MARPAGVQTITNEPPNNYKTMKKKSFIVKSLAFVFGTALFAACTTVDNPVGPGEPGTEEPGEFVPVDVTAKVATDQWGGGWCATQYAPAVTTADGRESQLMENYQSNVDATGILLQQQVKGLDNGTYVVELYANAFFTAGRGFDSDMEDGATDVAYVFANDAKAYLTCNIAESTTENGEYTLEAEVTNGTLVIGLAKDKAGTNWHTIQIKSLTLVKPGAPSAGGDDADVLPRDVTEKVATNGWGGVDCGEWAAPAIFTADGRRAPMSENYNAETVEVTGVLLQQVVEGLTNGKYTVEIYANAFFTPERGFDSEMEDGATDVAYVFANDSKAYMISKIATSTTENGLYTLEVEVTDGTLTLGLGKDKAGTNWHTIQIKSLTLTALL